MSAVACEELEQVRLFARHCSQDLALRMQLAAQLRQEASLARSVPEILEPCAPCLGALLMEGGCEPVRSLEFGGGVEAAIR